LGNLFGAHRESSVLCSAHRVTVRWENSILPSSSPSFFILYFLSCTVARCYTVPTNSYTPAAHVLLSTTGSHTACSLPPSYRLGLLVCNLPSSLVRLFRASPCRLMFTAADVRCSLSPKRHLVGLAYQPPANGTFLSKQASHQPNEHGRAPERRHHHRSPLSSGNYSVLQ
jgi:hypothetical protein